MTKKFISKNKTIWLELSEYGFRHWKKYILEKKIQKQNWGLSTDFYLFMWKNSKRDHFMWYHFNQCFSTGGLRLTPGSRARWVAINLWYCTMRWITGPPNCVLFCLWVANYQTLRTTDFNSYFSGSFTTCHHICALPLIHLTLY